MLIVKAPGGVTSLSRILPSASRVFFVTVVPLKLALSVSSSWLFCVYLLISEKSLSVPKTSSLCETMLPTAS